MRKLTATLKRRNIGVICSCDLLTSGFSQAFLLGRHVRCTIHSSQPSLCLQKLALYLPSSAMQSLSGFGLPGIWSSWLWCSQSHDDHTGSGRVLLPTPIIGEAEMIQLCYLPQLHGHAPTYLILPHHASGLLTHSPSRFQAAIASVRLHW